MRLTLPIFFVLALLSACGKGPEDAAPSAPAVTAAAPGIYEVGVDLPAGVWTGSPDCVGIAATSREYDLMTDTDPDAYLTSAMQVGDVQRIVLVPGQFFHAEECPDPWTLEEPGSPASNDPATVAGACRIILGGSEDLLNQALTFPRPRSDDAADALLGSIQEQLFTIVAVNQKTLAEPVGQIIDFLDAPTYYREGGELDASITRAVSTIRKVCADQ